MYVVTHILCITSAMALKLQIEYENNQLIQSKVPFLMISEEETSCKKCRKNGWLPSGANP